MAQSEEHAAVQDSQAVEGQVQRLDGGETAKHALLYQGDGVGAEVQGGQAGEAVQAGEGQGRQGVVGEVQSPQPTQPGQVAQLRDAVPP